MSKRAIVGVWSICATVVLVGATYVYTSGLQSSAASLNDNLSNSADNTSLSTPDPTSTPTTTPSTSPSSTPTPSATPTTGATTTPTTSSSATPTSTPKSTPSSSSTSTPKTTPSSSTNNSTNSNTSNSTATTSPQSPVVNSTLITPAKFNSTNAEERKRSIQKEILTTLVIRKAAATTKTYQISFAIPFANHEVTVTVHSDPVTFTAKSNQNGYVNYTLEQTLLPGDHTVTVQLTDPDQSNSVVTIDRPFSISRTEPTVDLDQAVIAQGSKSPISMEYLFVIFASIILSGLMMFYMYRYHDTDDVPLEHGIHV